MDDSDNSGTIARAIIGGLILGMLLGTLAVIAALVSAGVGHGDYVAARALFPVTMLLTLVEGQIGWLGIAVALVQFPFYGGLLGWARFREYYRPIWVAVGVHLVAAIACFTGLLPYFS